MYEADRLSVKRSATRPSQSDYTLSRTKLAPRSSRHLSRAAEVLVLLEHAARGWKILSLGAAHRHDAAAECEVGSVDDEPHRRCLALRSPDRRDRRSTQEPPPALQLDERWVAESDASRT